MRDYARRTKWGHTATDNLAFVVNLPHRKSFSPDVPFYVEDVDMKFAEGGPLFAVEVRSDGDHGPSAERRMAAKRVDYFATGTQVVWDVDLQSEDIVRVYHADNPNQSTIYCRGDAANAEPAVPNWTMPVDDLFP